MKIDEKEYMVNRYIEAVENWEKIMRNPDRCKIECEILGEAMFRLDEVEKKLMKMGYPVED